MLYQLTNNFTRINELSGTVQNSSIFTVEMSNKNEIDSGILLYPRQSYSFSNTTIYLRCIEGAATVRVVTFGVNSGSGGGGGGSVLTAGISNILIDGKPQDISDGTATLNLSEYLKDRLEYIADSEINDIFD